MKLKDERELADNVSKLNEKVNSRKWQLLEKQKE